MYFQLCVSNEACNTIFPSKFDALKLLVRRFGKIPPSEDFGYFCWLLWLRNPIFRHDFEIGHLVGVLAYYPLAKNLKSRKTNEVA